MFNVKWRRNFNGKCKRHKTKHPNASRKEKAKEFADSSKKCMKQESGSGEGSSEQSNESGEDDEGVSNNFFRVFLHKNFRSRSNTLWNSQLTSSFPEILNCFPTALVPTRNTRTPYPLSSPLVPPRHRWTWTAKKYFVRAALKTTGKLFRLNPPRACSFSWSALQSKPVYTNPRGSLRYKHEYGQLIWRNSVSVEDQIRTNLAQPRFRVRVLGRLRAWLEYNKNNWNKCSCCLDWTIDWCDLLFEFLEAVRCGCDPHNGSWDFYRMYGWFCQQYSWRVQLDVHIQIYLEVQLCQFNSLTYY